MLHRIIDSRPYSKVFILPNNWQELCMMECNRQFINRMTGLTVILSIDKLEHSGTEYIHLSASHHNKLPKWDELGIVKDIFIGDKEAYQIFPIKSEYVNLHKYCLHIFSRLDGEPALN